VYYTNYLRYMQEAAMDASAAGGFGRDWYLAHGTIWLVRETEIEFLAPLRYGDSVRVKTWVKNVRQALSRRAYELRREATGEIVARAETDWAYLDATTGRPARVPKEFRDKLLRDAAPPPPRDRFPEPPLPPRGAFRQRRRVEWRDIDPGQHVNNSVYLAYVEDCAVEASLACGFSPARMRKSGYCIELRACRIEYRAQATLGDDLEVATWLSDVGETSAVRHFTIVRPSDGATVSRARTSFEWRDVESGRSVIIPGRYRDAIAPQMSNDAEK
jgi:acyl-CoA thioester hydrolase